MYSLCNLVYTVSVWFTSHVRKKVVNAVVGSLRHMYSLCNLEYTVFSLVHFPCKKKSCQHCSWQFKHMYSLYNQVYTFYNQVYTGDSSENRHFPWFQEMFKKILIQRTPCTVYTSVYRYFQFFW